MVAGVRYSRNNPYLTATMIRGLGFFLFATAYWALLPLVAREQIGGGPGLYGVLLGTIGAGAVGGAFLLPWLKTKLGPDLLVATGTLGSAMALVLFGISRDIVTAVAAGLVAGASWIAVLASLNVSAQLALPEWVRARGLAAYLTIVFGAMTISSAVWGRVAETLGLPTTHFIAALGVLAAIPLTWHWKLQTGAGVDLTPSMHWPVPITTREMAGARGPVLVTVEYRIDPKDREAFLKALGRFAHERRRDGAYGWGAFEDSAEAGRFIEAFFVGSWLEHLRQHERITHADRALQDAVTQFQVVGSPKVSHLIAAGPKEHTEEKIGRNPQDP
jgi:hypothetical protein